MAKGITVDFNADVARFTSSVDKMTNDLAKFQTNADRMSKNVDKSFARLGVGLKGVFSGLTAALSVRELGQMADSFSNIQARLKLATRDAAEFAQANENIKRIAESAKSPLEETATLYTRISQSLLDVGGTQQQIANTTQALALGLRLSGATAEESASAMLQFSQAIGSGVLRGEEFNAVNEAAPRIMKALADSLGVPVGKLREMAKEGQLTRDILVEGLGSQLPKLLQEAETLPDTLGSSFTALRNQLVLVLGELDKYTGTSGSVANFIGEAGKVALEAIIVLGANLAFVFKGVYSEITGIGRQLEALSRLDFKGFTAIGDAIKADAERARKELDAFEQRILNPKKIEVPKLVDDGSAAERMKQLLAEAEELAKREEALKAAEKAAKALASQQKTFIEGLEKEASTLGMTSVQQKLYEAGILQITGAQLSGVKANAERIENYKQEQDVLEAMRNSYADAADSYLKFIQATQADVKSATEKVDRLKVELGLMDKTEAARNKALALLDLEIKYEERLKELRGQNISENIFNIEKQALEKAKAHEQEVIRLQEFLDTQKKAAAETQKIWDNFGFNFQRNIGDQIYNTLNGNFKDIGSAWKSMLTRMLADAAAAQLSSALFGKDGSGGMLGAGLKIFSSLLGAAGAMGGGAGSAGQASYTGYGGMGAPRMFAKGDVFGAPTLFKFADGGAFRTGLMGEAGPEAIMPLKRDSDGRLGVSGGGGGVVINDNRVVHIDSRSDRAAIMQDIQRANKQSNAELIEKLERQRRL